MSDIELLTPSELASKLKVTKSWVYVKTRDKGPNPIPRIMCGRHLRFELDKVMAWLRNQDSKIH